MYQEHFGLRELPFSITPDTGFFFSYGHYADALNTLLVALRAGEGFIKVTGEVGTGKTLLCRKLLATLDRQFVAAYLPNPMLTPYGLQSAVAEELGVPAQGQPNAHRLQKRITERILQLNAEGKRVVLCLDEAQAMPIETLETLRLLTNLETEKRKLLQVVLFGQPELEEKLNRPEIRQLRQRITFAYRLEPIDREGMNAYVQHRLMVAGHQGGGSLFRPPALQQLYRASGGIPRLVNILAHKSLMAAYGRGAPVVDREHVRMAIADTEDVSNRDGGRGLWWLAGGLLTTLLAAAGWLLWQRLQQGGSP